MHFKGRRSVSSCGMNKQHSNSVASLEGGEEVAHKKNESSEIQKKYLRPVYDALSSFDALQVINIDGAQVADWKKSIKTAILRLREFSKQNQLQIAHQAAAAAELEEKKNIEIRNLRLTFEDEIKFVENQNSNKLLHLNAEFGRKEQQYKQIVLKFIESMHIAQKTWSKIHSQLLSKVKRISQLYQHNLTIEQNNRNIYHEIKAFTDELYNEEEYSLSSANFSQQPDSNYIEQRRDTIDMSQIQHFEEPLVKNYFEDCLMRMICWGFFSGKNSERVKKLMEILKNKEEPQNLLTQPIFPIIIESFKLNLQLEKSPNVSQFHDSECEGMNRSHERIVMRDIENESFGNMSNSFRADLIQIP